MNQITVQEVQDAYRTTGMKPRCNAYGDGKDCGCPIVALWVVAGAPGALFIPHRHGRSEATNWAESVYGPLYVKGFINGVDGNDHSHAYGGQERIEYDRGHKDGVPVREAVFA